MTEKHDIRLATEADAKAMLAIYAPVVRKTAISFELHLPSVDEFRSRVRSTLERAPWLVCEIGGYVAGYAYAGPLRTREAYQWSVEVTVYVHPDYRRHGVGSAVYTSLFECLRFQGYLNAYGGIALPNPGSISLHESMGFLPHRDIQKRRLQARRMARRRLVAIGAHDSVGRACFSETPAGGTGHRRVS